MGGIGGMRNRERRRPRGYRQLQWRCYSKYDADAAPKERHVFIRMNAKHVDPSEETLGDLPRDRFVVCAKMNPGPDATMTGFI